jgi:hypothetical protein
MKRIFARALCAISLAGFGSSASAVPIHFDFTGSITGAMGSYANSGLEGTAISGGFYFETDGLTQLADPWSSSMQYDDTNPPGAFAYLNFGTHNINFPIHPESNEFFMAFRDYCSGSLCIEPYYADAIELYAGSSTVPFEIWSAPGFVGSFSLSRMTVTAIGGDFLDWEQAVPTDLVTLPLPTSYFGNPPLFGGYSEQVFTCAGGGGCNVPVNNGVGFNIDSVTRVSGARDVPEPDSLLLFAMALLALPFIRRRRAA